METLACVWEGKNNMGWYSLRIPPPHSLFIHTHWAYSGYFEQTNELPMQSKQLKFVQNPKNVAYKEEEKSWRIKFFHYSNRTDFPPGSKQSGQQLPSGFICYRLNYFNTNDILSKQYVPTYNHLAFLEECILRYLCRNDVIMVCQHDGWPNTLLVDITLKSE